MTSCRHAASAAEDLHVSAQTFDDCFFFEIVEPRGWRCQGAHPLADQHRRRARSLTQCRRQIVCEVGDHYRVKAETRQIGSCTIVRDAPREKGVREITPTPRGLGCIEQF